MWTLELNYGICYGSLHFTIKSANLLLILTDQLVIPTESQENRKEEFISALVCLIYRKISQTIQLILKDKETDILEAWSTK